MKTKIKSKLMSILLVLVMVLSIVPFGALPAFAEEPSVVVTHDVDEIRELLRQDGDVSIKLDADANKTIVSTHENRDDEKEYEEGTIFDTKKVWTRIGSGNKTIDLNGHRLYVTETLDSRAGVWKAVMMEIPTGASLTVNDSAGGGLIWFDAEMYDPEGPYFEGDSGIKIRDTFYVTGGDLTVNGGEIHAGRARRVWTFYVAKYDKNWRWPGSDSYEEWYENRGETPEDIGHYNYTGYATQFNSGTAITAYDGNVIINGGNIWGRGWDNFTMISKVPNTPNGADDHRDRCAALRVKGGQVTINGGEFYGRSDADAIQVLNPNDLTVNAGTFDVATNDYLREPHFRWEYTITMGESLGDVHVGNLGSFGVPNECINDQSIKVVKGNTMTLSKNAIDPYIVVDDLTLYVNAPLDYSDISTEVYRVPEGCTVKSVTWYKNGAKIENPESTYFQEGQRYSVYIALSVDIQTGTKFTNRLNDATINGKEAEINRVDEENLIMSVDFGYCTAALEELEFEVIEPEAGQYSNIWVGSKDYALYDAVGTYGDYGEFRQWYVSDDGETWTEKSTDDTFEVGKYYRFSFEVHAGEGQEFALDGNLDPDVSVTVNGITAATVKRVYDQDPSEHILVQVDFGQCPALISNVELTVTAPKDGENISYTVGSAHDTYYAIGDSSNYTDYRQWLESDTGYDNWRVMTPGETFTAGKYYKFVTDVYTTPGYEFPTYDNGVSIMPGVNAYINGYGANVSKGYEQDPSRYITVEYFFGICNDSVVENIIIENVTAPVAGEKPNYNWSIRGNGYQMDTSKNAYYDAYWKNPPEQWYYIKNGLGWFDVTDYDWVYENETFIAGHEYEVRVYVITGDGFEFAHNNYYEPTVTATVNGNTAEAIVDGSYCVTTQQIEYTFTCGAKTVDKVAITDLENPVGGNTPDTTVTVGDSDSYTVESVEWFDIEDNPVGATFETDVPYYALITLTPATGAVFADAETIEVTVNGSELDSVEIKDGKLLIYVIIRKPASAPIVNPYAFTTQPTGGTVSVGETLTAYWQTSFIPTDTEIQYWDGEDWDQWDIQQAQSAVDSYDFVNADVASYRFRIVTYIGSDVVATSDEFVITWKAIQHTCVGLPESGQGATCTVDGWKDYYRCECGKYYEDANCQTPINDLEAWKVGAGKIVAEHKYGDLIEKQSAVHTQTELKAGMEAHYKCSVCQGYFDENKKPTTEDALIIAKPEHSYGDWVKDNEKHWKVCSCGLKADEHTHNYTDNADMICNDCGWDRTVQHVCGNGTKQDGQDASCTVNGWKDYYKCSCGKIYTDAACTNEITSFEEWKNGDGKIAATHSYGDLIAKVDATCSQAGMQAHFECSVCHTLFDADKAVKTENELTIAIDANAHTYGSWTSNGDGTHTRVCSLNAEHKENGNCAGGTATCAEKAVCATCNTAYGNTAAHSHGSEWKTDEGEHWNECACGDKANKATHTDSNNDGKCDTCEYQMTNGGGNAETPDNPNNTPDNPNNTPDDPSDDKDGLGAGAIVGIVIGSVAVVGIGGFALFWFVIKKKSFADLIAVFKKK